MTDQLSYMHPQLRPLAVPVDSLTPDPKNARKRDRRAVEAIKASIESRGFRSIIVVQKNAAGDLIIRAGNGRYQAAVELGLPMIPALVFEEGDSEAVAYAIADNRTAELAEWDWDNLSAALSGTDVDWGEMHLFEDHELSLLTASDWEPPEPDLDADEAPGESGPEEGKGVLLIRYDGAVAERLREMADERGLPPGKLLLELAGLGLGG